MKERIDELMNAWRNEHLVDGKFDWLIAGQLMNDWMS